MEGVVSHGEGVCVGWGWCVGVVGGVGWGGGCLHV